MHIYCRYVKKNCNSTTVTYWFLLKTDQVYRPFRHTRRSSGLPLNLNSGLQGYHWTGRVQVKLAVFLLKSFTKIYTKWILYKRDICLNSFWCYKKYGRITFSILSTLHTTIFPFSVDVATKFSVAVVLKHSIFKRSKYILYSSTHNWLLNFHVHCYVFTCK